MLYEEKFMDGKLWCRSEPNGQWRSVSYEMIMGRMLLAERSLQKAVDRITELNMNHRR